MSGIKAICSGMNMIKLNSFIREPVI